MNQDDLHTISGAQLQVLQEARNELDRAFLAQFRADDAEGVRHLRTALDIDPTYAEAWNNLSLFARFFQLHPHLR